MNKNIQKNPISLFHDWLKDAEKSEMNDPSAVALATSDAKGRPSVRMILLKQADEKGFKFHTNQKSNKGNHLSENPYAALCFHWKTLRKQVRVEGDIELVSTEEADTYFTNRPYERQIGAWASQQSQELESRASLEEKISALQKQYPRGSTVPRPPYWIGYRLVPTTIEFWWDNTDRLHDRLLYTKTTTELWDIKRLYP